jgi:hypothetical protein
MPRVSNSLKSPTAPQATSAVRHLAPEDVARGDYLAVLHDVYEVSPFGCFDEAPLRTERPPLRLAFIPREPRALLKVVSICVPFVVVQNPAGQHSTLDLRLCAVGRVDRRHAERVWKIFRRQGRKAAAK